VARPHREARPIRLRLLIADDHRLFAQALSAAITSEWLEVVGIAGSGRETVDMALALDPDVVLLDLEMPDLDGFEAMQLLREHGSEVTMIVLTGSDGPDRRRRARELGAKAFLTKTQSIDELIDSVRAAAALARAFREGQPPEL